MPNESPAEAAIADLMLGTAKALAAICRNLIDAKVLNREMLIADLISAQVEMPSASLLAAVPAALAAELGAQSPKTDP